jgi:transposase-like protein
MTAATGATGARAVPFYCPYCGEEDLRPHEQPPAAWHCADCQRVFVVNLVAIVAQVTR